MMGCLTRALGGGADVRPATIARVVLRAVEQDRSGHSPPLLPVLDVRHLAHDGRPELDDPLIGHLAAPLEAASASSLNKARRIVPPPVRHVVGPAPCLRLRRSA